MSERTDRARVRARARARVGPRARDNGVLTSSLVLGGSLELVLATPWPFFLRVD